MTAALKILAATLALCSLPATQPSSSALQTSEDFSAEPEWEGRLNHNVPVDPPIVTQDFGYSQTNNADGISSGELGGQLERSTIAAWYAEPIQIKNLDGTLLASGRIAAPNQNTGGGFHLGWFNSQRQGWRPWSSLGFRLDGQGLFSDVHLDYMTETWMAGGLNAGDLNPPLTIPHDGSSHTWRMEYDPAGDGVINFTLDNNPPVMLHLAPGHKAEGGSFDRFGLLNRQVAGSSPMTVYFDDLQYNGTYQSFENSNTGWEQHGNRTTYSAPEQREAHNFGFSNTIHAGGTAPGEVGGLIWRASPHNEPYYADPIDPLTLEMPLFASGKVALQRGASDGGMYFGWFNKQSIENVQDIEPGKAQVANFLGVNIEGPSAVGHYFRPVYATSAGERRDSLEGPIIFPDGAPRDWTLSYDATGNSGGGVITVTLDEVAKQFNLAAGDKNLGAVFDHFGLFSLSPDGLYVEVYFDDLSYTSGILKGDFNFDGIVNDIDIDLLRDSINRFNPDPIYDLNGDSQLNSLDLSHMITITIGTVFGDADLNKTVNFADFVALSNFFGQSGTGWRQGNFLLDDDTDFIDFVILSNNFGIMAPSNDGQSAIPEPIAVAVLGIGSLVLIKTRTTVVRRLVL